MSVEGSEYVVDEVNAERLTNWLNAGKWTRKEASLLFLEIDPDSVTGDCFCTFRDALNNRSPIGVAAG